jgi:hypothetical protein
MPSSGLGIGAQQTCQGGNLASSGERRGGRRREPGLTEALLFRGAEWAPSQRRQFAIEAQGRKPAVAVNKGEGHERGAGSMLVVVAQQSVGREGREAGC